MSKSSQQKKKKALGAIERPKLDNAGKLKGIYHSDLVDMEFKDIMKHARKMLEVPLESAMPCELRRVPVLKETCSTNNPSTQRTRHGCVVEAHDSARKRTEETQREDHEDHVAEKWFKSLSDHNLVHKVKSIRQEMKIASAKAAVDQEWEELDKLPARQVTNVKSKREVIEKATK